MRRWLAMVMIGAWPGMASASTVAVWVSSAEGPVPRQAVEATAWHALHDVPGVDPEVLDVRTRDRVDDAAREVSATTVLELSVRWRYQVVSTAPGFSAAPRAPEVDVVEHRVTDTGLEPGRRWTAVGAASVYRLATEVDVVSFPELALQEAISVALDDLEPEPWGRVETLTRLPVVVAADDAYRAFYGPRWRRTALSRIDRASALLAQAGVTLDVVAWQPWDSPGDVSDLSALLEAQAEEPMPAGAVLRVGFTQQVTTGDVLDAVEDVGRAFVPGRDVVVLDQAAAPGHLPRWDVAQEGVAVAHEVLHALGIPHADDDGWLMSPRKSHLTHALAPRTRALAAAAAEARVAHWDGAAALERLARVATEHLAHDPALQIDYVATNVARGPGVPPPGSLEPERMTALANAAVGTHYLATWRQAAEPDAAAAHRESAMAHSAAALRMAPQDGAVGELERRLRRERALPVADAE